MLLKPTLFLPILLATATAAPFPASAPQPQESTARGLNLLPNLGSKPATPVPGSSSKPPNTTTKAAGKPKPSLATKPSGSASKQDALTALLAKLLGRQTMGLDGLIGQSATSSAA
ncbi:hypothetical protein B0T25DRAFT_526096 [Lasiosphaeria hispida]|uniref:Uncharacterized protein n=1 Tax=Lasiosphaeria hispida TaxID=260671 RepID=A0AAJ0MJQ5_9PEZI|nr:hypothetical protein B0T25DRAFT_526096 [Lasiosphaeria hispida]